MAGDRAAIGAVFSGRNVIRSTALSTAARLAYLLWLVRLAAGIAMNSAAPFAGAESPGEAALPSNYNKTKTPAKRRWTPMDPAILNLGWNPQPASS